ncbi:MAG: serine hydrolase, partial [Clostridia bacterium]|nr:serine hydrolase [Clostridia bacterium]
THADLAVLMIILSDNTATNILADILGIGYVNGVLERYGLSGMCLRRKMFDGEAAARGLENTVTARACAVFFRRLLKGELVSPDASRKMLSILSDQRLNGKIPFYLHGQGIRVAHKTGEDDGVSHDAGVIFSDRPVIAVFLGNDTDVPAFERYMQDTARLLV